MQKETRKILYQKVLFYYMIICCAAGVALFWLTRSKWLGPAVAFLFVSFWTALAARPMRTEKPMVSANQRRIATIFLIVDAVHLILWYLFTCGAGV